MQKSYNYPTTNARKHCPTTSYQSPRNCLATDCLTSYRYSLHYNFKVVLGSAVCHKLFPPLNTLVLGSAVCHKLFPPLNTSVLGSAVHQLFFPPPTVSFEALRSAVHLCQSLQLHWTCQGVSTQVSTQNKSIRQIKVSDIQTFPLLSF